MQMLDPNQLTLQYITDKAGEKTAVILPIQEFQELLEDIEDLAAVAERREEPSISHDELLAELRRDGLLKNCMEAFCRTRTQETPQRDCGKNFESS
jgi:hypothetical protein